MEKIYYWTGFITVWGLNLVFYAALFTWLYHWFKRSFSFTRQSVLLFGKYSIFWNKTVKYGDKVFELETTVGDYGFIFKKWRRFYLVYRPKKKPVCKPA